MIKVNYYKDGLNYKKVNILGHALYDDYGKDIVCAAVSSIVICTINGILTINEDNLKYNKDKDGIKITYINSDDVSQKLIDNMISLLKELEESYSSNIKTKEANYD